MRRRDLENLKSIQTTYGKLTIFQEKTNEEQTRIDDLLEENKEKFLKQHELKTNNEFKDSNEADDFYGVITNEKIVRDEAYKFKVEHGIIKSDLSDENLKKSSDTISKSLKNELNFIDQVYDFDKIEEKSINISNQIEIKTTQIVVEKDDNFIDRQFFSSDSNKTPFETSTNVLVEDLIKEKDLNFFDETLLQVNIEQKKEQKIEVKSCKTQPDTSLLLEQKSKTQQNVTKSSIIRMQEKDKVLTPRVELASRENKSKERLKEPLRIVVNNSNKDEIPFVIDSKKVQDVDTKEKMAKNLEIKQKYKSKQPIVEYEESRHDVLLNETPKWYSMTIDEGAELLKKHICHFNIEHGIFALDKPYGLPSHGGPGVHLSVAKLLPRLKEMLNIDYPLYMMNRLDENTTGVQLFATSKESELRLREWFNEHKVIKQYVAIVKAIPSNKDGEINIPLIERVVNGVNKTYLSPNYNEYTQYLLERPSKENPKRHEALTRYRTIDANPLTNCALVECQPQTGIKHQIRVHLSYGINCPILGDHKYSHHLKLAPQKLHSNTLEALQIRQSKARHVPMHLHSFRVILSEWYENKNLFINAKLPIHFLNNLKRLKLKFI